MDTPSVHGLLEAWERGQGRTAPARGLLLLQAAFPDRAPVELAALTLGARNRLLLDLRIRLFGTDLEGVATCPACGETLETHLPLFSATGDDVPALPPVAADVHEVTGAGWRARFRLPTTADLLELPQGDAEDVARWLLVRCVVEVERDGHHVAPAAISGELAGRVAEAMAALDPEGVVELVVGCPQCGAASTVLLEPAAFLWTELDQWAWRVLAEVRDLATGYGWAEHDILALSPWRRQAYLELLPA